MKRLIEVDIKKWIDNKDALPLFLFGARQVGKTYIVKKMANEYFSNNYIYINFFNRDEYYKQLKDVTSPNEIINIIQSISKLKIKENTLIIFDEVQEMPNLKVAVKLFSESEIKTKIICLGSYLANTLHNDNYAFPVGKIQRLEMYPLNFEEFLMAFEQHELINDINNALANGNLSNIKHNILVNLFYEYLIIGGMPEVVKQFIQTKDYDLIHDLKISLLKDFRDDITKYINKQSDKMKCLNIFDHIPEFLSKENKKYKLSTIEKNARYLNYDNAIKNLMITKIIYKINNIKSFSSPINTKMSDNEFKIYFNDCGLLTATLDIKYKTLLEQTNNNLANQKGGIGENFVISELIKNNQNKTIGYYSFLGNQNKSYDDNKSNTHFEIDLCLEDVDFNLIPIEIKLSHKNLSLVSLNKIINDNKPTYSIVFSTKNIGYDREKNIYYIPIYMAGFIDFKKSRINFNNK